MALNPPLTRNGIPIKLDGEYFAITRDDVEFEADIMNIGKRYAKGKLYMSTARFIFVNNNFSSESFKSFDIPLVNIMEFKFVEPFFFFMSDYLSIRVRPLYDLLPSESLIKISFRNGKCEKIIQQFKKFLHEAKTRKYQGVDDKNMIYQLKEDQNNNTGFIDAKDSSMIYLSDLRVSFFLF